MNQAKKYGFSFFSLFILLLSSFAYSQKLIPVDISESSPREELRKRIFASNPNKRACEVLSKDPAVNNLAQDPSLKLVVQKIIESIKSRDEKALRDLFNPRVKVKSGHVLASIEGLKKITGQNLNITNYRVVALNSPDGSTEEIECEDTGVFMNPLYGYPLTAGIWLQATGDDEVARIFAELVPDSKSWTIGAWHIQQWTHAGKDFEKWYDTAEAEAKANHKGSAFINADMAVKLMDGGGFIRFPVKTTIENFRDSQLSRDAWQNLVKSSFPSDEIIYVNTLFARSGAAILLRFRIKGEMSATAIREHCRERLRAVLHQEWMSTVTGIRCAYSLPREDVKAEGVLGGLFIPKTEANKVDGVSK